MTTSVETRGDPITTEIIRNAFVSCAQDMNATLIRSSYTPIIYEGKDCSVAILDDRGDVLGQSLGLPLFLGNLEICVKLAAELFGWDAFRPGDVFYMNDSYMTGTHLNDATIFGPIFWNEQLVGFSATRAHWLDVGAKDPGGPMDSHEIFQEGMRWGPTRIYDAGSPREDIIDLLRRNGRFGYSLVGDMNGYLEARSSAKDPLVEYRRAGWEYRTGRRRQALVRMETFARAVAGSASADFREMLDFPPAPKLDILGKLDPAKATQAEMRGQEIFFGKGQCATCHQPPFYTDNLMHNLQTERFFKPVMINNMMAVGDGPIKTFGLRGVKDNPPYLHDERLLTLEDTVEFFNLILGTKLAPQEKQDLVAFLRVL